MKIKQVHLMINGEPADLTLERDKRDLGAHGEWKGTQVSLNIVIFTAFLNQFVMRRGTASTRMPKGYKDEMPGYWLDKHTSPESALEFQCDTLIGDPLNVKIWIET